VKELLIAQPDSGEAALDVAEMLIRSAAVDVVVVDSVAALAPKAELEAEMGDVTMGAQARLMGRAMRKLVAALHNTKTLLLFTNQLREKIGVIYGSPEYQPGGRALKFFASVRLDIRRKDPIKSVHGTVLGHKVRVKVVKNKVAPPFLEAEFDILFSEGISRTGTLVDLGVDHAVLEKSGAWYSWAGEKVGQGRDGAKEWLNAHPKKAEELEALLRAKLIGPSRIMPLDLVDPAA
jgi:recombination protein RecA